MDADDEDILVMGAVEDRDLALARRPLVGAPQVIVGELDLGRDLERGHCAAHRVERAHQVAHRPVLAGGVDALEHDQDRVLLLRPEPVLEAGQPIEALLELTGRRRFLAAVGPARIDGGQADLRAGLHLQELTQGRGSGRAHSLDLERGVGRGHG